MNTKPKLRDSSWLQLRKRWAAQVVVLMPLLSWLATVTAPAQTYTVLHNLTAADGANSHAGLVLSGTKLYGAANEGRYGGTVFKLNTDGTQFAVIRNFNKPDLGTGPIGDLVLAGTTLYGTTYMGGSFGYGVLFRMRTDGSNYVVLKHFSIADGAEPSGVRLFGDTLYGVTGLVPVLFRISTSGSDYTVLRRFGSGMNAEPELLLLGTELYGAGGVDNLGTAGVFKVDTNGSNFTVLRSFAVTEGIYPAGFISYCGWLYGTMTAGGSNNCGTLFKITTNGADFAILKHFAGFDGVNPVMDLVRTNNTLFGITDGGGGSDLGTVFMINTDGKGFQTLKSFAGPDGCYPGGTLLLVGSTVYGTTRYGGSYNNGVIFALSVSPPTLLQPLGDQTAEAGSTASFHARAGGDQPLFYHWFFNVTNLLSVSTNSLLQMSNIQSNYAGSYSVIVSNIFGAVTSAPAMLSVIPPVERRLVVGIIATAEVGGYLNLDYANDLGLEANWLALDTFPIASSPQFYFDTTAPLQPQRFYRAWQSVPASVVPSLGVQIVSALTLTGTAGNSVRVDGINQFGPIDAWFTLNTVTLTNTSQLYFDVTAPGQPARLYRIVVGP